MNLGQAKTRAIQLINEYSNNGALISDTKNADYRLRFNNLADYVQNEISDRAGIDATYTIDSSTTVTSNANNYNKYDLPANYKEHRFVRLNDENYTQYRIEIRQFWVPDDLPGTDTLTLGYFKYPTSIDDDTADSFEFELDAYTHTMIPYYLAGMVLADENAEISNKLLNIYYERLGQTYKRSLQAPKRVRENVRW